MTTQPTILELWQKRGRPFILGDVGEDVRQLQRRLLERGFDPKGADGEIGRDTRTAIIAFQRAHGLLDDGRVSELTATAIDGLTAPLPAAKVITGPTLLPIEPPWLKRAISLIGTLEPPGNADNPVILAWAKACGGQIAATYKHDATPWCKMFVEFCLRSTGFKGTDDLWALNIRDVGTKLAGPAVGALASKSRDGGGHTFIVRGRTAGGVLIGTGGNQSDAVCNANFDPNVCKYNWPAGYPVPTAVGFKQLPIVAAGKFTRED